MLIGKPPVSMLSLYERIVFYRRRPEVDFVTSLSLDECQGRLFEARVRSSQLDALSLMERPVTTRIGQTGFFLRRRISYRNDLQFGLYCTLESMENGTRVRGILAMRVFATLFMVTWLSFPIASFLCMTAGTLIGFCRFTSGAADSGTSNGSTLAPLFLVGILIAFGASLVAISWLAERRQKLSHAVYLRLLLNDPSRDPGAVDLSALHLPAKRSLLYHVLISMLSGAALLLLWRIMSLLLPSEFFQTLPAIVFIEGLTPTAVGIYFAYRSSWPDRYGPLLNTAAGGMVAALLLACGFAVVGFEPYVIPWPFLTAPESSGGSVEHWIVLAASYAFYAALGGCLGWLIWVRPRRDSDQATF